MKIIKLYEEYKRTHNSINDISIGDWIRTQQEEFEVINKKENYLICKSFCDPNRIVNVNPNDVLNSVKSDESKRKHLKDLTKFNYDKYLKDAGLLETKIIPGREKYLEGKRVIIFLDDSRNPFTSKEDWISDFSRIGTEDIYVKHLQTYKQFIDYVSENGLPTAILFDNDLGKVDKTGKNGIDVATWLVRYCLETNEKLPEWSIISANPYGRCRIGSVLRKYESLTDDERENLRLNKIIKK